MNTKIRIVRDSTGVTVHLFPARGHIWVSRVKRPGGYDPAKIQWTGSAAVGMELVLEFANTLSYATGIAERLDLNIDADIRDRG